MAAKYVEFDREPNFIPKFSKIGLARQWAIGAYAFAMWPATEGHRNEMVKISVGIEPKSLSMQDCFDSDFAISLVRQTTDKQVQNCNKMPGRL